VALPQCPPELFQEQMVLNFFTAVNTTQAALPSLLAARGRIVNIASLAARTPWRWVAPYVTSKAALAAYTDQLRFELPELNSVTLVCPGPLIRADAGERYNAQAGDLQEAARRPAAGAKLSGIDPDVLARRILQATAQGRRELIVPAKAAWLFALSAWSPSLGDWLRRRFESRSND
jgi:NAD(P)-dependent dehydrogenase (short-subunit alcohol dehydrogenase family)